MKKTESHFYFLLLLALMPCVGQTAQPSSATDCLPVLAKDYYSYAMKNNLQEDFLRSIDSESYSQAKEEIKSSGSAYGGAFSGSIDYNKFNEERNKYLETTHYSRTQQQALDILKITTSDRAYTAYEACLRSVATGPAVLAWATSESMNEIELRVRYVSAPNVPTIELIGQVEGGSVSGQPSGFIWSKGPWWSPFNGNKWGVNVEKRFTIKRDPATAETKVIVTPVDGSAPFQQTFKRADAMLTLAHVGKTEVFRNNRISDAIPLADNNENKSRNCRDFVGLHDGRYCTSRTTLVIKTVAPRFLKNASPACVDPKTCGWLWFGPAVISSDGLTATSYVDNWGAPFNVFLKAEEYEQLSSSQCGSDQKIPVIFGYPVVFSVANECMPIAQLVWQTLTGIPSQGSVKFSSKRSPGDEVEMVGDLSASGSMTLASYKLNKLPH